MIYFTTCRSKYGEKLKLLLMTGLALVWSGNFTQAQCLPPGNTGNSDYYISHAQSIGALNDVDQYSGFSNGGYADYTSSIAPLEVYPGQDVGFNIEVQNQGVATNSQVEIWVDYNSNGDFSDPGENIISSNTSPTNPFVGTYHVPGNANLGTYHLRVRSKA